jgi:NADPH2:quinone reductase
VASSYGYRDVFTRDAFATGVRGLVGERGVDVALDSVAGPARAQSLELLAPLGRLAVFGNAGREQDITVAPGQLWLDSRAIVGYNIGELAMRCPQVVRGHALQAVQLLVGGRVVVDVADVVPLAGAGDVHRALETGATNGKFVLAVGE